MVVDTFSDLVATVLNAVVLSLGLELSDFSEAFVSVKVLAVEWLCVAFSTVVFLLSSVTVSCLRLEASCAYDDRTHAPKTKTIARTVEPLHESLLLSVYKAIFLNIFTLSRSTREHVAPLFQHRSMTELS